MSSIPDRFPVSLRAWPSTEPKTNALPTVIQRVNFERGGFRDLTEDSLRQEIQREEAGADAEEDNGSSEDDAEEGQPDRLKELVAAREDMRKEIEAAHLASMYALDFVSLLLSKDAPVQAGLSLSAHLRESAGMGTLGADRLPTSRLDDAKKQDNMRIAKGWKVQNIDKTVDSILASATRLQKEIETETKYWEQVLAVSEKGWALCRLPQERHTLGVRFGFSEAAPIFRNRSLAAIRRNLDGSVYLDQGLLSPEPCRLRVRIEIEGIETGQSPLPRAVPDDAPIEDLILQARNTVFSEELWQELNRESRSLATYGVRAHESTITWPISPTKTIVLDLVPIGEAISPAKGGDNTIAEAVSIALHILLSFSHRKNHRRRVKPQPAISAIKRPNPPYDLLRPLITRLAHQNALEYIHSLFSALCATLASTGLRPTPSYNVTTTSTTAPPDFTAAESILTTLLDRLEINTTLTITPSLNLTIKSRTAQYMQNTAIAGTFHYPLLSSTSPSFPDYIKAPPALTHLEEIEEFVCWIVACGVASVFATEGDNDTSITAPGKEGWYPTSQPNVLRKSFEDKGRSKQLCFEVKEEKRLEVRWEWMSGSDQYYGNKNLNSLVPGEGVYNWTGKRIVGDHLEEIVRDLGDVVEEAGKWVDPRAPGSRRGSRVSS